MIAPAAEHKFGLFAIEWTSEEEGSQVENHELVDIFPTRDEALEHAEPFNDLTSRIRFYVLPLVIEGRQITIGGKS